MGGINDKQIVEFLLRSYSAVDGLWFMKVEERLGFDAALEIDNAVWEVMAKIQARKMKELLGRDKGIEALKECFTAKLKIDGCELEVKNEADGFKVIITRCAWHGYLVRSGREHISDSIGRHICSTEFSGWAKEFGDIEGKIESRICAGGEICVIRFTASGKNFS